MGMNLSNLSTVMKKESTRNDYVTEVHNEWSHLRIEIVKVLVQAGIASGRYCFRNDFATEEDYEKSHEVNEQVTISLQSYTKYEEECFR